MTTQLTDSQKQTIRIALAKWMGWQTVDGDPFVWQHKDRPFILLLVEELPNYPASLDACHEIELLLTYNEYERFSCDLWNLTNDGQKRQESMPIRCERRFISASAEHRSLALYFALNLGELGD